MCLIETVGLRVKEFDKTSELVSFSMSSNIYSTFKGSSISTWCILSNSVVVKSVLSPVSRGSLRENLPCKVASGQDISALTCLRGGGETYSTTPAIPETAEYGDWTDFTTVLDTIKISRMQRF